MLNGNTLLVQEVKPSLSFSWKDRRVRQTKEVVCEFLEVEPSGHTTDT